MKTSEKLKSLRNKCDKLWSEAVRTRDGECVLCGRQDALAAHHWIRSRAQGNKHRWNIKNGITLCFACHIYKVHTYASADILGQLKQAAFDRGIITPEEMEAIADDHEIKKMGVGDMETVKDYLTAYLESLKDIKIGGTD